jgi:hypothetical protein
MHCPTVVIEFLPPGFSFRAIGTGFSSFNNASKVSGLAVIVLLTYNGCTYTVARHHLPIDTVCVLDIIYKPSMHPWFVWLYWINPLSYALEGLMASELAGRVFPCEGVNLIPSGPAYAGMPASCSGVPGSIGAIVNGSDYLGYLNFSRSHIWRNFGIIWVWWFLFVLISKSSDSHLWSATCSPLTTRLHSGFHHDVHRFIDS